MFANIPFLAAAVLLTNAAEIVSGVAGKQFAAPFEMTGTITFKTSDASRVFAVEDESNATILRSERSIDVPPVGSVVRASGRVKVNHLRYPYAACEQISVISNIPPTTAVTATIGKIQSGHLDNRVVCVTGVIREVFRDEIDSNWIYLVLSGGERSVYITVPMPDGDPKNNLAAYQSYTDAKVEITGLCLSGQPGLRRLIGRSIRILGHQSVKVLRQPPKNPFDVPLLDDRGRPMPMGIADMGRRRVIGTVIAALCDGRVIIRDENGMVRTLKIASEENRPGFGDRIEAIGFPETDLYRLNLSNVTWRKAPGPGDAPASAEDVVIDRILSDGRTRPLVDATFHGRLIRLRGTLRDLPAPGSPRSILTFKCGAFNIPVDFNAIRELPSGLLPGSVLEVSGTCVVETENWRPYSRFPHTTGIILVPRSPDDIRIISRPPWWTPGRLLVVIGSLFAVLIGILIWNRILNRLVERRSRELLREQAGRVGDKLKVGERTRLAVELHDSLSQTLTGVSFQIDAAEQARQKDPSQIKKYLDVARQTLKSCREELRNCLWDLRNNALEEADAEVAIRRTVEPQIGEAELAVDFRVPRQKLTDNTFHAILCIVRELSVNATRHGSAAHIAIDGRIDGGRLVISVADDGSGFDPQNHLGVDEGHFGLLGVQERIEDLDGTLSIDSAPGRGSRITIEFTL